MAGKTHKDVEFMVEADGSAGEAVYFKTPGDASAHAVALAISGHTVFIDVLISSEAGARFYGGDDAVEQYKEDPDASVHERFEVKVNCQGRVP